MIQRLKERQDRYQASELVDECLLLTGGLQVSDNTHQRLTEFAAHFGEVSFILDDASSCSEGHVVELLQLILATREYQMA